jgi:hypothetical protein
MAIRIPGDIKRFLEQLGTSSLDLIQKSGDPISMGFGDKASMMTIEISRAETFVASIKLERKKKFRQAYNVLDERGFDLEPTIDKEFGEDTLLNALTFLSQETLDSIRLSKEPITFSTHSLSRDCQVEVGLYLEDGKTVPHISIEED